MAINSTQLTTTGDTAVYTSLGTNAVLTVFVCNTGTPDNTDESVNLAYVNINLVPSGGASSVANTIVTNLAVPAGETIMFSDEKIVLEDGDMIKATASVANLLSVTVSSLLV